MNVSIIVLTHNSSEHLKQCIDSILKNMSSNDELIIIDNKSTDSTQELLIQYSKKCNVYFCNKNVGICEGRNLGDKLAKNDVLAFVDSDIVLNNGALDYAKKSYIKNNAKALVGSFAEYGQGYNWFVEMRRELFSTKRKKNFNNKITLKNFTCFCGGLCFIEKLTFIKYGGYDITFSGYPSEDINLELLMLRDNVNIIFEKNFRGNHLKSKMEFTSLSSKFKKNGIAISKLIKSSIKNNYKIPFNSGWPYLPYIAPLEIFFLILSYMNPYFLFLSLLLIFSRIIIVFAKSKRKIIYNIRFIFVRFYLDIIMFISIIKGFINSASNIDKLLDYQYKKIER